MIYVILGNKSKANKWRKKHKSTYTNFCNFKQCYYAFRELYPQIKAWLDSQTFKTKYIDTNHPYPPLLNPDLIDYNSIPAELAWEMNLPLPQNYRFIFLASHGVGRAATGSYLQSCGVPYFNEFQSFCSNKERYEAFYELLCLHPNSYNIITFSEMRTEQEKLIYLIEKRPFLILIRDPISNLKSLINYPQPNLTYKKKYWTLQDRDFQIFGKFLNKKILDEKTMLEWIRWVLEPFCEDSIYKLIDNKAIIIQTEDVKPQNAFETFTKLAKIFGFELPKESNRQLFETNLVQGMLDMCLPLVLKIYAHDLIDINTNKEWSAELFISNKICWNLSKNARTSDFEDITKCLNLRQRAINGLCVKIKQEHFTILQKDLSLIAKIKSHLEKMLKSIYEQNELYKKYFFTEQDILMFLKHAPHCREKFKIHLDKCLIFFKQNYPKIVQSWKFYGAFEKICADNVD